MKEISDAVSTTKATTSDKKSRKKAEESDNKAAVAGLHYVVSFKRPSPF